MFYTYTCLSLMAGTYLIYQYCLSYLFCTWHATCYFLLPFRTWPDEIKATNIPVTRYKNLSSHELNLAASPEMLSPHSIVDAHNIS